MKRLWQYPLLLLIMITVPIWVLPCMVCFVLEDWRRDLFGD